MSHDQVIGIMKLKPDEKNFHNIVRSHGMQFGIEIPGYFKWSLAQYVYAQWAGLYENWEDMSM
jgi:hypothetical protein